MVEIDLKLPLFLEKTTPAYKPPIPFLEPDEECLKAGNDCVYQSDGELKMNYMDFEAKGAYCRAGQTTKMVLDAKNRKRICCEPKKGAVPFYELDKICPSVCALEDDGVTPMRWSLLMFSPELMCKKGYTIKVVDLPEGKKCCCFDDKLTTTTTTSEMIL